MDSARALLKKVQEVLKDTDALTDIVEDRVYGAVPAGVNYPFVLVTCESAPFSSASFSGMQHTLRVQSFARENKPATVVTMREAIYDALHRNEAGLALPGNELVLIEFDSVSGDFPEDDGRTYQSFIEFKALVI